MPARRTIAIGDVHGCSKALKTLIDAIGPTSDDQIVTLGDYVNRGPNTRGVLDTLEELSVRCRLIPLLGNHDEMLLRLSQGDSLSDHPEISSRSARDCERELSKLRSENLRFLKSCVESYETETHFFVHAAYDPAEPSQRQPGTLLRWHSLRHGVPRAHYSGRTVVCGHTSQKNGEILDLGHIVCIDTYCYGGGWLTGLDVLTGQVWQTNRSGRLRIQREASRE